MATLIGAGLSLTFMAFAVRDIPIGTAYAIWTGVGAASIAAIGIVFFGEPGTSLRIACIAVIVAGIVGLKLAGD